MFTIVQSVARSRHNPCNLGGKCLVRSLFDHFALFPSSKCTEILTMFLISCIFELFWRVQITLEIICSYRRVNPSCQLHDSFPATRTGHRESASRRSAFESWQMTPVTLTKYFNIFYIWQMAQYHGYNIKWIRTSSFRISGATWESALRSRIFWWLEKIV